ncbi:hypothetical protein Dimus_031676 [Dionaea muscipula]
MLWWFLTNVGWLSEDRTLRRRPLANGRYGMSPWSEGGCHQVSWLGIDNPREEKQRGSAQPALDIADEDGQERASEAAPENNEQFTSVYVGNLAPKVTSVDVHRHFHALGAGTIEDVWVQRDKGFGFVRYSSHPQDARAILLGNARTLFGKLIKNKGMNSYS